MTMLFISYINLGRSISFPLFKSSFMLKRILNKMLTLKFRVNKGINKGKKIAKRNKILENLN